MADTVSDNQLKISASVYEQEGKASINISDNYSFTLETGGTLTITKRSVTLSGVEANDKVYDKTTDVTISNYGSLANVVSGDVVSFKTSALSAVFDSADAGSRTVNLTISTTDNLSGNDVDNYELDIANSQRTTNATISKKEVTITADDKEITYGDAAPAYTVSYSGFIDGESASSLGITNTPTSTYSNNATDGKVGNYAIQPSPSTTATNYTFKTVDGTLTVKARKVGVQAKSGSKIEKVYDGTTTVQSIDGKYEFVEVTGNNHSGLVYGDQLTLSSSSAVFTSKNASASNTVKVTNAAISNGNYSLNNTSFDIAGSITQKEVTITADDKEITYGDAAPAYTVSYSGFIDGEDESTLEIANTPISTYSNNATDGKVDTYAIQPSKPTATNYKFKTVDGTLTVKKKTLTLTPQGKATEGQGDWVDLTTTTIKRTYDADGIPTFNYAVSGFVYSESTSDLLTVPTTPTYSTTLTVDSTSKKINGTAGTYNVTVDTKGFSSSNYDFTSATGHVEVVEKQLKISGISDYSREYDGTKDVKFNLYLGNATFAAVNNDELSTEVQTYFENHPSEAVATVTATTTSSDVGEYASTGITITAGTYLSKRYILVSDSSQSSIKVTITKKPVTITAKNITVSYATTTLPESSATFDGIIDSEKSLVTSSNVTFTNSYSGSSTFTSVGTYEGTNGIVPSNFTGENGAFKATNYDPSYVAGKLTVTKVKLATPTVTWDGTNKGTVNITSVSGIGDVAVANYTVELYKGQTKVETQEIASNDATISYDFASTIRTNGSGIYTVKVTANASTVNNADYINVANSDTGTSGKLYATKVSVVVGSDTYGDETTTINNASDPYTMIAGEGPINIGATLHNATGYTVESVTSNNNDLSIATGSTSGTAYSNTVSIASTSNYASDTTITIALKARAATLDANLVVSNNENTAYGYGDTDRPKFTITPSVETGDNIQTSDYTYSYVWSFYTGTVRKTLISTYTDKGNEMSLPSGYNAFVSTNYYTVTCTVKATRNDNGKTIERSYSQNFEIRKAKISATVSASGWVYGEDGVSTDASNPNPKVTASVSASGHPGLNNITYSYATIPESGQEAVYSETVPVNVGNYYVKAKIPASDNYEEYNTQPAEFSISQASLDTPTNLKMSGVNSSSPYGLVGWDSVSGIAKTDTNRLSEDVTVTYKLVIEKLGDDNNYSVLATIDNIADTSVDITQYLQSVGVYRYKVQAISSDTTNCASSEFTEYKTITITDKMSVYDEGTSQTVSDSSYTKTYDAKNVILTAPTIAGFNNYKWYLNGTEITDAITDTLYVMHVGESGTYTCVVSDNNGNCYTPIQKVTINKREISLYKEDTDEVYDKQTHSVTVGTTDYASGSLQIAGSDVLTLNDATITQTNAGTYESFNVTPTWSVSNNSNNVTDDYNVTVTAKLVIGKSSSFNPSVTITGWTYGNTPNSPSYNNPSSDVYDYGTPTITYVGVDETTYTESSTVPTNAGNYKVIVTWSDTGNCVEKKAETTFTISKRDVTFTGGTHTDEYTGSVISYNDVATGENELLSGHTHNVAYTVSGTDVKYDGSQNIASYSGTITAKDKVKIKDASGKDVTSNYNITTVAGSLTINKSTSSWNIFLSLDDDSKVYNGTAQGTSKTVTYSATGATTYEYYSSEDSNKIDKITDIKLTNVGSITIYAEASNPNFVNTATVSATFEITKRPITFTSSSDTKVYDGSALTNNEVTVSGSGLVGSEEFTFTVTGSQTNVGSSANTFTYSANDGTNADNYNITSESGTLTVTQATNSWTTVPSITNHTYGESDTTSTGTPKFGDVTVTYVSIDGTTYGESSTVPTNAGKYTAKFKVAGTANYTGLEKDINYEITKRLITIDSGIEVDDRQYDGTTNVNTSQVHYDYSPTSYTNVIDGDNITYTASFVYDDPNVNIDSVSKEILNRTVNISNFVLDDDSSKNYVVDSDNSIKSVTSKILKADVTVTANNNEKFYGETDPELQYTYTKVNNEDLALSIGRDEGEKVGTYAIHLTQEENANPNYDLTFVDGVFTIKQANVSNKNIYINLKLGNNSVFDLNTIVNLCEVSNKLPEDYTARIVEVIDDNNLFKGTPTLVGSEIHFGFTDAESIEHGMVSTIKVRISSRDLKDFDVVLNVKVLKDNTDTSIIPDGWTIIGETPTLIPGSIQTVTIENVAGDRDTIDIYVLPEYIYHYDAEISDRPEITDDVYTKTIDNLAIVHCTGDINYLQAVYFDGELIVSRDEVTGELVYDEDVCTVEEGSTIIRFAQAYMDKMAIGYHDVEMKYQSGSAYTEVLVKELPKDSSSSSTEIKTETKGKAKVVKVNEVSSTEEVAKPSKEATTTQDTSKESTPTVITTWALLDLVIMILSIVFAIIALFIKGKRSYCITGIVNILIFIFTQDLRAKMVIIDKYTIIMAIIMIIEILIIFIKRKKDDQEDEEESPQN